MVDNPDLSDDVEVKGIDSASSPTLAKGITYTEDGDDNRGLDTYVINPDDFPGGANNKDVVPCYSEKLRYINDSSTVALTGSYADQYQYSGSGRFTGFVMEFSNKNVMIKLLIDGADTVFDISPSDIDSHQGNSLLTENLGIKWEPNQKTFTFYPRYPICFDSQIQIQAKETSGSQDRLYYLVAIEKVT